ncbi:DUF4944 domain-containing protein [Listeria riparia]|uniref:Uncharacterized protein n=1 Tax=Listeria riparia FSL S10-1204 TaxID=1265816 RepID=W7DIE7_9LIST|nr:DUF4944 domain-containing protein [Listeria riparia]EUJ45113.1 hypothetical protein PRIP_08305 [Listeria riparia FSL S10-1204]
MNKKMLLLGIVVMITIFGYFIYKVSFSNSNYKWSGHNHEWEAKYEISRNSAKNMYSGTLNWIGDVDKEKTLFIYHIDTFFDGKKVDLSEINSDYHKDLPFAEFHQNVEKDTKIKIIIFGEIGEKGFTEELSLSRGE